MRPKRYYRQMTREKAETIRADYFSRRKKQAELAVEHGIRQNTVSRIVAGLVWA